MSTSREVMNLNTPTATWPEKYSDESDSFQYQVGSYSDPDPSDHSPGYPETHFGLDAGSTNVHLFNDLYMCTSIPNILRPNPNPAEDEYEKNPRRQPIPYLERVLRELPTDPLANIEGSKALEALKEKLTDLQAEQRRISETQGQEEANRRRQIQRVMNHDWPSFSEGLSPLEPTPAPLTPRLGYWNDNRLTTPDDNEEPFLLSSASQMSGCRAERMPLRDFALAIGTAGSGLTDMHNGLDYDVSTSVSTSTLLGDSCSTLVDDTDEGDRKSCLFGRDRRTVDEGDETPHPAFRTPLKDLSSPMCNDVAAASTDRKSCWVEEAYGLGGFEFMYAEPDEEPAEADEYEMVYPEAGSVYDFKMGKWSNGLRL